MSEVKARNRPVYIKCQTCSKVWNVSALLIDKDENYTCPKCSGKKFKAR